MRQEFRSKVFISGVVIPITWWNFSSTLCVSINTFPQKFGLANFESLENESFLVQLEIKGWFNWSCAKILTFKNHKTKTKTGICLFPLTSTWFASVLSSVAPVESKSKLINGVIQQLLAASYKFVLRVLELDGVLRLCCVYLHASSGLAAVQRCSSPSQDPAYRQDPLGLITKLSKGDRWRL